MASSIYAHKKNQNEKEPQGEQEPEMAVEDCLAYLDIAIKKVNKSKQRRSFSLKSSSTDISKEVDSNRFLSSLALANHRDTLGRRNCVCSTEPKTEKVLKSALVEIVTATKLEQYGIL